MVSAATDYVTAFGIQAALGLGVFALASEWLTQLNDAYLSEKEEMQRWAAFERHGSQGYVEHWQDEEIDVYASGESLIVIASREPGEDDDDRLHVIHVWPLNVRAGRRNWPPSVITSSRRIFRRRARAASEAYAPLIEAAMKARKQRYSGMTEDERAAGKAEDERLDALGMGELYDKSVMNGLWFRMLDCLWRARAAWVLIVFGAGLGTVSAVAAMAAILLSPFLS